MCVQVRRVLWNSRREQKSFRRAVDRNLLRRRIRDVFRRNKSVWPERVDIVVVLLSGGAQLWAASQPPRMTRYASLGST